MHEAPAAEASELPPGTRRLRAVGWALGATALAIAGVWSASLSPHLAPLSPLRPTVPLLAATILALLAGLHRRGGGGTLGLASAVYPLGFATLGVVPTALAAGFSRLAAFLGRRLLEGRRPEPPPERRGWARGLAEAAHATLVGLAAGSVQVAAELSGWFPLWARLTAAGLVALGLAAILELAQPAWIRREPISAFGRPLVPLLLDAFGWLAGGLILMTASPGGLTLALAALYSLLAFEIARYETASDTLSLRLEERIAVARAGASLVAGQASELERVAAQIFYECASLLPFSWLHLHLVLPDGTQRSWWSGEGSALAEGEPAVPPYPPPLPGIHRRRSWHQLERVLAAEGERYGRIRLWSDPRRVDPRSEELLEALVPQMSASVRAAYLDHAAKTDRLTGLPTRRRLEPFLEEAFRRTQELGSSLAVAVLDLDHFKRINDNHGHAAGDEALVAVGRLLGHSVQAPWLAARFGGEEFVIVAPETEGRALLARVEALRQKVEALEVTASGAVLELSVSVGVAAYPELAVRRAEDLLEIADQCLLEAKRLGRNLCLLALGAGRRLTGSGQELETEGSSERPVPRFFA